MHKIIQAGKNPATPRTKEELDLYYSYYLKGYSLKEISLLFHTDAGYQLNKYGYKLRNHRENMIYRRSVNKSNSKKLNFKFENISNDTEAYILGIWYSDGWVNSSQAGITLHKDDKKALEKIQEYISKELSLKLVRENAYKLTVSSMEFSKNLINLGCVRGKTYKQYNLPKINEKLLPSFIRGYFDGDGSVYMDRKYLRVNICSINKNFLMEIQNILKNNNIESTINEENRTGKTYKLPNAKKASNCVNMYRLFIRKTEELKKLYQYLYTNSTIHFDRKYDKFKYYVNTVLNSDINKSESA